MMIIINNYPSPTRSVCEDTLVGECVSYPSPTRSVCEDTLVGECVSYPSPTCSVMRGYGSYPEHVYTWEGYSSHSVSSCVCLCVST